ncbi:N-acetylmuramoyl-L-alanine amidase [Paroceanicella profunda]|uniref:N-acetylmuramoyl-L-alanine amidase n=1 Tax=Paroceanicella profunda TaxID=2579971 RepID=A0A5B8G2U7_9RHOB|nr:N-acetylmuramoyl-L-alanine amidase [Paroceanicella profunda]QDL92963.1 N-acetylmuramoyl-L-alanine amidase [Paroceanicella profunda]
MRLPTFRREGFIIGFTLLCAVIAAAVWLLAGQGAGNADGVIRVDDGWGVTEVTARLTAPVAYRVFTLDDPRRVVVDFENGTWPEGTAPAALDDGLVSGVRIGLFRPGTARMVVDLSAPAKVKTALFESDGFHLTLEDSSAAAFAQQAGAPRESLWATRSQPGALALPHGPRIRAPGEPLVVMLDPGHGGIDPGAMRNGLMEKDIVLRAAKAIGAALEATGRYIPVLSREDDTFLPLDARVQEARRIRADVFISLHVNTVTVGQAQGVSVYSLSETASDKAAARIAALENRADILAGVDLEGEGSMVARVLVDMAQRETNARSRALAAALVQRFNANEGAIRSNPHREAGFRVLKAPDIPSVLIELGFLSDPEDRERMQAPDWGDGLAREIIAALDTWAEADRAARSLVRH